MRLLFNTICLFVTLTIAAQNNVKGIVKDALTDDAITWADAILYKENALFKGETTNDEGFFTFNNIEEGNYILEVSYLGYKTFEQAIKIPNVENTNLQIILTPESSQLKEVVIQADVTTVRYKNDKKIINVGKDLLNSGTVAGEILAQLPSISVDDQNNISLRGDQNVVILIDGKKSALSNDRILQQIPSESIATIEIINNPSAKYQAEGLSGIINIITKKSYRKGGKVDLTLGAGTGEKARYNNSLGASYATEKFKATLDFSNRKGFRAFESNSNEERETFNIASKNKNIHDFGSPYYVKTGIDFYIDSTNTISTAVSFNKYAYNSFSNNDITTTDLNNISNQILYSTDRKGNGTEVTYNLNHRKEFNQNSHYLETDINYSSAKDFSFSNLDNIENGITDTQNDTFDGSSKIATISSDYYNENDNRTLEFGARADIRNLNEMQESVFSNTSNTDKTTYKYNDGIYALYAVFSKKIGVFDTKIGTRLEHIMLDLKANESTVKNNYTNFFPSASISYKTNGHNLSLNYSRRISRPNFWAISNIVTRFGKYSQFTGNPDLQPEFANKIELNYSKKFAGIETNASLFLTNKENTINFIQTFDNDNVVNTFDNVGSSNLYGLELYARYKATSWLTSSFNATYYLGKYNNPQFLNNQTFSQDYSLNNTFKPFKDFSIQANLNYSPTSTSLQSKNKGMAYMSIALSQDLLKGKGSLSLRANDIFNSRRNISFGEINGLVSNYNSISTSSRHIYLTFKYNFSFGNKALAQKNRERKEREYTEKNN